MTPDSPGSSGSRSHGAGDGATGDNAQMLTALVQLHSALQGARLPLQLPEVAERREAQVEMVDQLADYAIPRLMSVEAPLLTVVAGSTGAGKSTLVNSLVGHQVSQAGVLRPTTRSAVLVHHPEDEGWFGPDRLLPDLSRVAEPTTDPGCLQLVATDAVPKGLAILDAPDVDSVDKHNRELAAQLMAAADLWLFVTSAARYADQVPWEFLKEAGERSTAVAIVLDRTPADAVETVATHLARMLASRGLRDSPLFIVHEGDPGADGVLPPEEVGDVVTWLASLAADQKARESVVRQTLSGTIRTLAHASHRIADAAEAQIDEVARLRRCVDSVYDQVVFESEQGLTDGSLMTGELLARWHEFAGNGELLRSLETRVGMIRDRIVNAVKGKPQQAEQVAVAVAATAGAEVVARAERATADVVAQWRTSEAGAAVVRDGERLERPARELARAAERTVREWQREVTDLVREESSDKRTSARFMAFGVDGLGATLAVAVLGGQEGRAARQLLDAVLGPQTTAGLVERAAASLKARVRVVLESERERYAGVLDRLEVAPDSADRVRAASRRVDDIRFADRSALRATRR
ncbi:ABC transporter [Nocardioides zeae]|uniref:ABC transporter n=1 Tax=Nocardioides imazamoxiresistens TaxID=3231893 RepID=A0ABU3PSP1_9ACTN|nr:GTPase [Nocardioides zeae]MDT9591906.1 ABC transporter [Nocardioides zeae]